MTLASTSAAVIGNLVRDVAAITPRALDGVLWTLTHLDDLSFALVRGAIASATHPERHVYPLLAELVAGRPVDVRVRTIDRGGRYVVVSDHHLLYASAPHDYFGGASRSLRTFRNERIYAAMIDRYAADGWTLVENGDVEDLVVPEPAYDRLDCLAVGAVGRVVFRFDDTLRIVTRKRQLLRIVHTYAGYYQRLLAAFGPDRIVKLVGNHDAELLDPSFAEHVPLVTGGVPIHEFAVIPAGPDGPAIVICHGHQLDPWTCRATARAIGESITESFAWAGQGADRIWDTTEWGPPLAAENAIVRAPTIGSWRGIVPKVRHMSERYMARRLARTFPGADRPWLVLGHTHEPRFRPAERYVNAAAAGRYQDLVWACEIDRGAPKLVAYWCDEHDQLVRGELAPDGDRLTCPTREVLGPLPALPYAGREPLDVIDRRVDAVVPPPSWSMRWLAVRIAVHALFLAAAIGIPAWLVSLAIHH
ncbi:MAG: hypothetical protein ABMB14_31105 [Myxococcota bacterium]